MQLVCNSIGDCTIKQKTNPFFHLHSDFVEKMNTQEADHVKNEHANQCVERKQTNVQVWIDAERKKICITRRIKTATGRVCKRAVVNLTCKLGNKHRIIHKTQKIDFSNPAPPPLDARMNMKETTKTLLPSDSLKWNKVPVQRNDEHLIFFMNEITKKSKFYQKN